MHALPYSSPNLTARRVSMTFDDFLHALLGLLLDFLAFFIIISIILCLDGYLIDGYRCWYLPALEFPILTFLHFSPFQGFFWRSIEYIATQVSR